MYKLIMQLGEADEYTRAAVKRFAEKQLDEAQKIRGQIARDLRRLGGDNAFQVERYYTTLREKYIRGHQSRKKLAILEMERQCWCHAD